MKEFLGACSEDELKRLEDLNMELGYNADDSNDKIDYFKHLPSQLQQKVIDEFQPGSNVSNEQYKEIIDKLQ